MKLRLAMLSAVVLLLPAATAADDGPAIVKQVAEAWEKRRQEIRSVRYLVKGTQSYNRGAYTSVDDERGPAKVKVLPEKDVTHTISMEYLIDFTNGRVRRDEWIPIFNRALERFVPKRNIDLCDGEKGYRWSPHADNTSEMYTPNPQQLEVTIYNRAPAFILEDDLDHPVLFAHGYPNLGIHAVNPTVHFRQPLPVEHLRFRHRGRAGNWDCVVLQTLPSGGRGDFVSEIWVDLERGGLVLRWNVISKGVPFRRIDATYRQQDGIWVLDGWSHGITWHLPQPYGLRRSEQLKVVEVEVNPRTIREDFTPVYAHKMVVGYGDRSGVYQVGSDDWTLVPYGQSTFIWRWWHWVLLTCCICLACPGVIFLCRRFGRFVRRRS